MTYKDEDVLHASRVELVNHLWEISESPGVKGEYPAFLCIVQIIPLHVLIVQIKKEKKISETKWFN